MKPGTSHVCRLVTHLAILELYFLKRARVTQAGAWTRLQLTGCSDAQGFNSSSLAILKARSSGARLCEESMELLTRRLYSLWGSNPRPMAHKTIALTTELREPCLVQARNNDYQYTGRRFCLSLA